MKSFVAQPLPPTTVIVQTNGTTTREMYTFILDLTRSLREINAAREAEIAELKAEVAALRTHLGI